MPITSENSTKPSGLNRPLRPPWVKESNGPPVVPNWRRQSLAKAEANKAAAEADKKEIVEPKPAAATTVTDAKKPTAPTTKTTTSNGDAKETTTKLQSKEIKVPIVTEKQKVQPPLVKQQSVATKDVKVVEKPVEVVKPVVEKKVKIEAPVKVEPAPAPAPPAQSKQKSLIKPKEPVEPEVELKSKANLRSIPEKPKLVREPSQKFIRPVLRKVPKVDEQLTKEIEKPNPIKIELKATPKSEPKEYEKIKIEPVILEKPKPKNFIKKNEPIKSTAQGKNILNFQLFFSITYLSNFLY